MGEIAQDRIARFLDKIATEEQTMDELLQRVCENESLHEVCTAWEVPYGRVQAWLAASTDRQAAYEGALRIKADRLVGETIGIADDMDLGAEDRKVRIATRFRAASLYDRARFGDGVGGQGVRAITVVIETTNGRQDAPAIEQAIAGESIHVGTDTAIESV
jgi:hypothetical protein